VPAREPKFIGRKLAEGQTLLEFAPYLPLQDNGAPPPLIPVSNYGDSGAGGWKISADSRGWEPVTVPSGTYRALRVELRGSRQSAPAFMMSPIATTKFEYTVWYSPDVRRYVKFRYQCWNARNNPICDEQVELLEYRPN
jgi:hypothetical protein